MSHSSGPEFLLSFAGPGWGTFPGAMLDGSRSRCKEVTLVVMVVVLGARGAAGYVVLGGDGEVHSPRLLRRTHCTADWLRRKVSPKSRLERQR